MLLAERTAGAVVAGEELVALGGMLPAADTMWRDERTENEGLPGRCELMLISSRQRNTSRSQKRRRGGGAGDGDGNGNGNGKTGSS